MNQLGIMMGALSMISADWQSPGMGSGPTDIGLFLARAELSGSDLSVDELIDAYFTSLNGRLSKPTERSSLERIVHSLQALLNRLANSVYKQNK
jgi:hypothetical protein